MLTFSILILTTQLTLFYPYPMPFATLFLLHLSRHVTMLLITCVNVNRLPRVLHFILFFV